MINDEDQEEETQGSLFDNSPWWQEHWKSMPEFTQKDLEPFHTLIVHFENWEDVQRFAALLEQTITSKTKSVWYPESEFIARKNKFYAQEK